MRISPNFMLDEFLRSAVAAKYGIDNDAGEGEVRAIYGLVAGVLQPWRYAVNVALRVDSGFRSRLLNAHPEIKGSKRSQHLRGEAADVVPVGMNTEEAVGILYRMARAGLPVDHVIVYHPTRGGHAHVTHTLRRRPRGRFDYQPPTGRLLPWSPPR